MLKDSYDASTGVAPVDNDWEFYIKVARYVDLLSMENGTDNALWYWDGEVHEGPNSSNPEAYDYSTKTTAGPVVGDTSSSYAIDYHYDGTVSMRLDHSADADTINKSDIFTRLNARTATTISGAKKIALYAYFRSDGDKITLPDLQKIENF